MTPENKSVAAAGSKLLTQGTHTISFFAFDVNEDADISVLEDVTETNVVADYGLFEEQIKAPAYMSCQTAHERFTKVVIDGGSIIAYLT